MTRLDVPSDTLFGLTNLPYGVYSVDGGTPRCCTRVGDAVIDLAIALGDDVFASPTLNAFMAQGAARWSEVRAALGHAVTADLPDTAVHDLTAVTLHLPIEVADYVDFYASEHHASNLGRLFRPDNPEPLLPNWKHLPVGYHGRASSIVVSGTEIVRPAGQQKSPDSEAPTFGPSQRLDIEAEIGFVVGAPNRMGEPIAAADADEHLFGVCVFNDWSARDIQAWEYVPLGPNLGKSFASTISPWIVPLAALEAARVPTPQQNPRPLPYLDMAAPWGLDLALEVRWNGQLVTTPPYASMYWSPAQMLAHLTVNGAPVRTGDLFASGTVSGTEKSERGAFIELTWGGQEPIEVHGEQRTFVLDGDTIEISATAPGADGKRIGFGSATATIAPNRATLQS